MSDYSYNFEKKKNQTFLYTVRSNCNTVTVDSELTLVMDIGDVRILCVTVVLSVLLCYPILCVTVVLSFLLCYPILCVTVVLSFLLCYPIFLCYCLARVFKGFRQILIGHRFSNLFQTVTVMMV